MEKARLPSPAEHPSVQKHRRELWVQILLPLLVAGALLVALIVLIGFATFREGGDVARWAAISTIWIVMPWLLIGVVVLVVFIAMIYGMARLLKIIPPYTGQAQRIVWRAQAAIQRAADMAAQPVFGVDGFVASIKRLFGMK